MSQLMREKLIDAAMNLIYKHGYHAIGIDQIITAVRTTKTTFYNHFESKEDVALACILKRDARWRVRFPELLREKAGDDPLERLRAVFDVWQDWFDNIHFNGCAFIHACSEFPSPHDPIHKAAKANLDALIVHIRELATFAGARDPASFAEQFKIIMQSAIIVEVIDRKNEAATTAARLAEALIERDIALPKRQQFVTDAAPSM